MAITVEVLKQFCNPEGHSAATLEPHAGNVSGVTWSIATNGYSMLAVRADLGLRTDINGPIETVREAIAARCRPINVDDLLFDVPGPPPCVLCKGNAGTAEECPECNGDGDCPHCNDGHCPTCHGDGLVGCCRKCKGTGLDLRTPKAIMAINGVTFDARLVVPLVRAMGTDAITPWEEPTGTVTGSRPVTSGGHSVADPRIAEIARTPWKGTLGVLDWQAPAPAVTASMEATGSNTPASVADPRLGLEHEPWRGALGVINWDEPAPTVRGVSAAKQGRSSVADPRLTCTPRNGAYGVLSWQEAAATVTGHARIDNCPAAVADPRPAKNALPPVIIAKDGTWHRPLTTLELAALQGLPSEVNGAPLKLAGKSTAGWRERVGNAVPVQAGRAIAETLLTALLATALGTWTLGSTGIWVNDEGRTEDEVNAEYEIGEARP